MYTTTINQNGMILLNKSAREALGLKLGDRVIVNFNHKSATVERELTDDEFFAKLDSIKSTQTKQSIKKHAGQSAGELFDLAMKKHLAERS
ncbi:AbrB/MazE/SpoVT family DNA-binding domain-containing protein [Candidatus Saccharibacteria bacterium]|nr:AbrB/MazE/SpoVT family DNA-binding domain-containing protein [Candidatus Saccharibacteria bacterium]MBQ6375902.1 AbrB/MazE/SpoVT family DNA-binding domain-containing protein [Candidatus Saccharibacteria bacterium]